MNTARWAALEEMLVRCGAKYAFDEAHGRHVARVTGQLADRLEPLLDLDGDDRTLLRHAALVHDIGHFVARRGHHRHSAYLIGADEMLAEYPRVARERLALLAGAHRKRLPDLPKWWSREEANRFLQAAALLRVADGLDYGHRATAGVATCQIGPKAVIVEVEGVDAADLDRALRRKAILFTRAFGRDLSFVPGPRPARQVQR